MQPRQTLRHNPQEAEQRAEAIAQLKAVRDELVELRQLIESRSSATIPPPAKCVTAFAKRDSLSPHYKYHV